MSDNARIVCESVRDTIERLTRPGTGDRTGHFTAWGTAMLAKLRRAAGSSIGESADTWDVTIGALPAGLTGPDRERAALALHTALTLFALHQQGRHRSVHTEGIGFGRAVKRIIDSDRMRAAGVRNRFNALATASEFADLSYYARGLVSLMHAKGLRFDYPRFAKELYLYQLDAETRDHVRMLWGYDFYALDKDDQSENSVTAQGSNQNENIIGG